MRVLTLSPCLLALSAALAGPARHYSTWMLESIIGRGEGINPADGLLGVIQKGLFQEALRAAIGQSGNLEQKAHWANYHQQSVEANIESLLNATAASRDLSLDRLCVARSLIEANLDGPIHRAVLKALRRSVDTQYRNRNGGLWYFVDPPPPYPPYCNLSYSDGMYAFAPFAALYGFTYGDPDVNLEEALRQLDLLYRHGVQPSTGLILHGYDASGKAPWADPVTGASPILWGRSLAWYMIGLVDTLEIVQNRAVLAAVQTETIQRLLQLFQQLVRGTVAMLRHSYRETGRCAVWQVMDQPGKPKNFVEASASAMIAYVLAKGSRLGYLSNEAVQQVANVDAIRGRDTRPPPLPVENAMRPENEAQDMGMLRISQELYEDVRKHFIRQSAEGKLELLGTSVIASLHEAQPNYEYYTHRQVTTNSLIGTSAFVLASLEMEREGC